MAVIAVYPGEAIFQPEGELDERGQRHYVVSYIVVTDDPKDGIQVVGDAPGIPTLYSTYIFGNDVDLGSTLKRIRPVRRADTMTVWTVYLEYDSTLGPADSGAREPTARRRKKEWSTVAYEVPLEVDLFGNPIMNAARDEFDPPAMRVKYGLRMVYQHNVATEADLAILYGYLGKVNEDTFQGFVPQTCCCVDVSGSEEFDNNQFFWSTTMTFEFRQIIPNPTCRIHQIDDQGAIAVQPGPYFPWHRTILNAGLHEIKNGKRTAILDDDKRPVRQPVRLEIDGTKMVADKPREDTVFLSWQVNELRPFQPLGIV